MPATYTDEQLLLYIYNEMSPQESQVVKYMLANDDDLSYRYNSLMSTVGQLNGFMLEPHPSSIEIILEQTDHLEPTC